MSNMHGTTILCVRQKLSNGKWDVAIGGDGQISLGDTISKLVNDSRAALAEAPRWQRGFRYSGYLARSSY